VKRNKSKKKDVKRNYIGEKEPEVDRNMSWTGR
jgi:hypothetical protein